MPETKWKGPQAHKETNDRVIKAIMNNEIIIPGFMDGQPIQLSNDSITYIGKELVRKIKEGC